MKYGIYYAYWEDKWEADYFKYIEKVAKLGFDFLEIACTPINGYSRQTLKDLRQAAKDNGIFLTAGRAQRGPEPRLAGRGGPPEREEVLHETPEEP